MTSRNTRFVPLFPPGKAPFKVVVATSASSPGDPFERHGRQTLGSRRLRAGIVSASGVLLDECVLHLPSEEGGEDSAGDVDRKWAMYHQMFMSLRSGSASGLFPELILPGGSDLLTLPPLVYCAVPDAFFELPCPDCLQPLETCRDDAVLAQMGLPLYSTSSIRVLVCPRCAGDSTAPTVITTGEVALSPDVKANVLRGRDFLTRISKTLVKAKKPKGPSAFCCLSCRERDQCWVWSEGEGQGLDVNGFEVAGSASQGPRWRVFTTNTVPYLLTRPAMTPYEVFVRSVGSEKARAVVAGDGDVGLLFAFDGSGLDAVEILALRLTAFGQAVRAVREHHRIFGRAHLDINSESLVVETGHRTLGLPALWNFSVRLEATSAIDVVDLGNGITVVIPPRDPVAPFFSPTIKDFLITGRRVGELKLNRFIAEAKGLWRIEGQLLDTRGVFPKPGAKDWIRIQWVEDPCGLGVNNATARLDTRAGSQDVRHEVMITTEPLPLDAAAVERIQRAGGIRLSDVIYRVYPHFDADDDAYSLGVVLLLSILVNDTQDLGLVMDDIALLGLHGASTGEVSARIRDQVTTHPETWGQNAVLIDAVDRGGDRPNAIPDDLWVEILSLALRMVSMSPDLTHGGDTGIAVFEHVEREVADILCRLRALLFDRQPLNLEIQNVISELLAIEDGGEPQTPSP